MALYDKLQFLGFPASSSPSQSTSKLGSVVAFVWMVVIRCDSDMCPEAFEACAVKVLPKASGSVWVLTDETDPAIESVSCATLSALCFQDGCGEGPFEEDILGRFTRFSQSRTSVFYALGENWGISGRQDKLVYKAVRYPSRGDVAKYNQERANLERFMDLPVWIINFKKGGVIGCWIN